MSIDKAPSVKDRAKKIYSDFMSSVGEEAIPLAEVVKLLQKEIDKYSDDPKFALLADAVWDCMDDQMCDDREAP